MKYKMMTASEAIDYLIETKDKSIDFTFDDLDLDPEADISGWYGAKIVNIFDENPYGFFVIGYYGGGSTTGYDIYGMVDDADDIGRVKDFMTEKLQNFMNVWCDSFEPCEKICVEIEEDEMMIYSKQEDCLRVKVDGGYLYATISGDIDYPGICVEFVADNVRDDVLSVPTVLIEKPIDEDLRVLVWSDEDNEDYTTEIKFN